MKKPSANERPEGAEPETWGKPCEAPPGYFGELPERQLGQGEKPTRDDRPTREVSDDDGSTS